MNTSSFLTALRSHGSFPLVFRSGGEIVSPGYHLTEVKRVSYETMDCGAMTHRWSETQFEIWVPAAANAERGRGHMAAEKFLRIIDRVETELPLKPDAIARIHASFAGGAAALYDVAAVEARDGQLSVELTPDRTRCKSAERRLAAAAGACCGSSPETTSPVESASSCGCGSNTAEPAAAVCCA